MNPALEIQLIAVLISVACALPGVFLVLRGMSMLSDSITHTILLGIVLAFFIAGDLSSPLLTVGAAAVGVVTVWLTETLTKTKLVTGDAATGVVFPLLFSIAVILISRYGGNVHLDTDAVLLGELAFAPFERLVIRGVDIGARAVYTSGALLLLNAIVIFAFFKELKLSTFDPVLAAVLGFSPALVHYGLMTLVSITAVGAFEAAGSILVVAFMIVPPASAYLLTDDLKAMLIYSASFAMLSAVFGYRLAHVLDVSIAGSMAAAGGVIFAIALIAAPRRGLISGALRRRRSRFEINSQVLLMCLNELTKTGDPATDISVLRALGWDPIKLSRISSALAREGKITLSCDGLRLTERGLVTQRKFMEEIHVRKNK